MSVVNERTGGRGRTLTHDGGLVGLGANDMVDAIKQLWVLL